MKDEVLKLFINWSKRDITEEKSSPTRRHVRLMAEELLAHRATMKRLEEWADEMDRAVHGLFGSRGIAAELRNRIKGGQ